MDIDATQAIPLSDYEDDDETDEEIPDNEKKPVAHLKVSSQKGFPETTFPIYEGDNLIGRHEGCNVAIPLKALSKQHAVIEVRGDQHFLVDRGSRNKTRRGKMFLAPQARYELRDSDQITFADVVCLYFREDTKNEKSSPLNNNSDKLIEDETGSETGSESMLFASTQPAPALTTNDGVRSKAAEEESFTYMEDNDELSSDILGPTQAALATQAFSTDGSGPVSKVKKTVRMGEITTMYAEDTDNDDNPPELHTPFRSTQKLVAETPRVDVVRESPCCPDAETQRYIDEDGERKKLADQPTQAYAMETEDADEDENSSGFHVKGTGAESCAPTQAYDMDLKSKQTAADIPAKRPKPHNDSTLMYDMDIESTQSAQEITQDRDKRLKSKSVDQNSSIDMDNAPTQTFPEDTDSEQTLGSTPVKTPVRKLNLCEPTMVCDYTMDSDEDGTAVRQPSPVCKASPKSITSNLANSEATTHTSVSDDTQPAPTAQDNDANDEKHTDNTVPVSDETVPVSDETMPAEEVVLVKSGIKTGDAADDDNDDDETQVVVEPASPKAQHVATLKTATPKSQHVTAEDAPTQVLGGGEEVATQVIETVSTSPVPNTSYKGKGRGKNRHYVPTEAATQVFGADDASVVIQQEGSPVPHGTRTVTMDSDAPTQPVFSDNDATQVFDSCIDQNKQHRGELPIFDADEATQVLGDTNEPTQVFSENVQSHRPMHHSVNAETPTQLIEGPDDATQVFSDSSESTDPAQRYPSEAATQVFTPATTQSSHAPQQFSSDEDTQVFSETPVSTSRPGRISSEAETQVFPAANDEHLVSPSSVVSIQKRNIAITPECTLTYHSDRPTPTLVINKPAPASKSSSARVRGVADLRRSSQNSADENAGSSVSTQDTDILGSSDTPTLEVSSQTLRGKKNNDESMVFSPPDFSTQKDEMTPPEGGRRNRVSFADQPTQMFEQPSFTEIDETDRNFKKPNLPVRAQKKTVIINEAETQKFPDPDAPTLDMTVEEDDDTTDGEEEVVLATITPRVQPSKTKADPAAAEATVSYIPDADDESDEESILTQPAVKHAAKNTDYEATQAYEFTDEDGPTRPLRTPRNTDMQATQAYGVDTDSDQSDDLPQFTTVQKVHNTDHMATQAYDLGIEDSNQTAKSSPRKRAKKQTKIVESSQPSDDESPTPVLPDISRQSHYASPPSSPIDPAPPAPRGRGRARGRGRGRGRGKGRGAVVDSIDQKESEKFSLPQAHQRRRGRRATSPEDKVVPKSKNEQEYIASDDETVETIQTQSRKGRKGKQAAKSHPGELEEVVLEEPVREIKNTKRAQRKGKSDTANKIELEEGSKEVPEELMLTVSSSESVSNTTTRVSKRRKQAKKQEYPPEITVETATPTKEKDALEGSHVGKTEHLPPTSRGRRGKNRITPVAVVKEEIVEEEIEPVTRGGRKGRVIAPSTETQEISRPTRKGRKRGASPENEDQVETLPIKRGRRAKTTISTENLNDVNNPGVVDDIKTEDTLEGKSETSGVRKGRGKKRQAEEQQHEQFTDAENIVKGKMGTRKSQRNSEIVEVQPESVSRTRGPRGRKFKDDADTPSSQSGRGRCLTVSPIEDSTFSRNSSRKSAIDLPVPSTRRTRASSSPAKSDTSSISSSQPKRGEKYASRLSVHDAVDLNSSGYCEKPLPIRRTRNKKGASPCPSEESTASSRRGVCNVRSSPSPAGTRGRGRGRSAVKLEPEEKDSEPATPPKGRMSRGKAKKHEDKNATEFQQETTSVTSGKRSTRGAVNVKEQSKVDLQSTLDLSQQSVTASGTRSKAKVKEIDVQEDEPAASQTPRKRASVNNSSTNKEPDSEPERKRRKTGQAAESADVQCATPQRSKSLLTADNVQSSPALRHKLASDIKPKVMFTGVVDTMGEKTVKSLGGEIVTCIEDCTHLVTDKVRRTVKFLCGLAQGILIVKPDWLDRCREASMFLNAQSFLVNDAESERKFKFKLIDSIESAAESRMLTGWSVYVTKSVKPEPAQMKDIIKSAGGEYLSKMPTSSEPQTIVVSCAEDEQLCKPAIQAGVNMASAEFILTGILRQTADPQIYGLFTGKSGGRGGKRSSAGATANKRKR